MNLYDKLWLSFVSTLNSIMANIMLNSLYCFSVWHFHPLPVTTRLWYQLSAHSPGKSHIRISWLGKLECLFYQPGLGFPRWLKTVCNQIRWAYHAPLCGIHCYDTTDYFRGGRSCKSAVPSVNCRYKVSFIYPSGGNTDQELWYKLDVVCILIGWTRATSKISLQTERCGCRTVCVQLAAEHSAYLYPQRGFPQYRSYLGVVSV